MTDPVFGTRRANRSNAFPHDEADKLADALNAAWGDWVADTGCYPDTFRIVGNELDVDFDREGNFMTSAVNWLRAQGSDVMPLGSASPAQLVELIERLVDMSEVAMGTDESIALAAAAELVSQVIDADTADRLPLTATVRLLPSREHRGSFDIRLMSGKTIATIPADELSRNNIPVPLPTIDTKPL